MKRKLCFGFAAVAFVCAVAVFLGGFGSRTQGWTAVSDAEASQMIGASGTCQECPAVAGACPGPAVIGPYLECATQDFLCLFMNSSGTTFDGCTSQAGGHFDCEWAFNWWCWEDGAQRCGNFEKVECDYAPWGGCWSSVPYIYDTGGTCRWDC